MARVHEVLRWANRRAVAEEVTRRGYRLSGETLNRWVRDEKEFPAIVERIVFDLFTIGPDTTKEPRPDWVEALPEQVAAAVVARLSDLPAVVQAAAAELGLDARPPDAPPHGATSTPADSGSTASPRRPRRASRR